MSSLSERLVLPEIRARVVDECAQLVHGRVAELSGLRGAALRVAYRSAGHVRPHLVHDAVDRLLPKFAERLEPWYLPTRELDDVRRQHRFREALVQNAQAVSGALLEVADQAVDQSMTRFGGLYRGVRAAAVEQVAAAIPNLADILSRYA